MFSRSKNKDKNTSPNKKAAVKRPATGTGGSSANQSMADRSMY